MHFEGAQALNIEQTVIETLTGWLEAKLQAFPALRDARISHEWRDNPEKMSSRQPIVWLSAPEGSHERELWRTRLDGVLRRGTMHTLGIEAQLYCSPGCAPLLQPLREALGQIIDQGDRELWELGLEESEFKPATVTIANANSINPHTFSCVAYTL